MIGTMDSDYNRAEPDKASENLSKIVLEVSYPKGYSLR